MKPKGSLPCSQEHTTGPYAEQGGSSPLVPTLSCHPCLSFPNGLFPSGFLVQILYAFPIFPIYAICPIHLTPFDLITIVIFGEVYMLQRFPLCSLFQPPATSFLLGPNIVLTPTIYVLSLT